MYKYQLIIIVFEELKFSQGGKLTPKLVKIEEISQNSGISHKKIVLLLNILTLSFLYGMCLTHV